MRIALAHKLYRVTGGAEVFYRETERVLRERGHETLMISTGAPSEVDGANILLLKAPAYDGPGAFTKLKSLPSSIYDPAKTKIIRQALEEFKPDILHVFAMNVHLSPSVVIAANELGIPVIGTFNDYKHICPNYKLYHHGRICYDCKGERFYNALRNNCCKESLTLSGASMLEAYVHKTMSVYDRFRHFTFSSDFLASVTNEFWPNRSISWSKLLNPFDSAACLARDEYEPFGLYFGRLIDEKGVDRLVDAAASIGNFRIKIVGDGPDLEKLKGMARDRRLSNVEFLGAMWGASLDDMLSRARFVVVPSIWQENFPYVINQAFAYARPVIGSNRGGIPELIEHNERGIIFEPNAVGELAAAIVRLAGNKDEAARMGRSAKIWSDETFCDERAYRDLMHAYEIATR